MMIFIGVIAALALIVVWALSAYNGFVRLHAMVQEAWSGIDVQLKRRYDLVPNLVAVVKQYGVHEKEIFEKIAAMRAASMGATGVEQKAQAESGLTSTLKTLFAISESYPELKANQNFLSLQQDLNSIEHELQLARRYYNGAARNYNTAIHTMPSGLVARTTGFVPAPYFELSSFDERQAPRVQF